MDWLPWFWVLARRSLLLPCDASGNRFGHAVGGFGVRRNNRFDLDLDAVQPHGRSFKLWARDLIVRGTVLGIRGVLAEAKVARRIGVAKARDATVQFAERRRLLRDQRIANDVSVQRPPRRENQAAAGLGRARSRDRSTR